MTTLVDILKFAWTVVRYLKPVRTFWITLAALLQTTDNGASVLGVSLVDVDWLKILSISATAAIINFIVLMAGGDSLWSEPKHAPKHSARHAKTSPVKPVEESEQAVG